MLLSIAFSCATEPPGGLGMQQIAGNPFFYNSEPFVSPNLLNLHVLTICNFLPPPLPNILHPNTV